MKIRLATFNLFQFVAPPYSWYIKKDRFNEIKWINKTTWIKNQIKKMNCDIIAFQEVFSKIELEELCKELGFMHFVTVDNAKTRNPQSKTYISMTVALASKYPIVSVQKVQKEKNFNFSRVPIKAQIKIHDDLDILVYVAHLKSNRDNEFEYIFTKNTRLEEKKVSTSKSLEENFSPSLKLRLEEASTLFKDVKDSLELPTILMCDLNDKEYSITIDALTNKAYHKNRKKDSYILYDAYYLYDKKVYNPHPEEKEIKRVSTSYYQSHGNVLDYIFISKHFNKNNKNALAYVSSYEVNDVHLQINQNGDILQSDHAQVICELTFKK